MYPIKFKPIVKDKIWGGNRLQNIFGKNPDMLPNIGESWELSAVPGNLSIVANGYLTGKTFPEIIETYKDQLVGKKVYEQHGKDFPLLFKLIDANDDLSIQVHPNDAMAGKRHNSLGKTEMWYVMDAEPEAYLIIGFKKNTTKAEYLDALSRGEVEELLQKITVAPGDVFFIPAGLVHAIGKGVVIAEIQQSSDITYRIFDFNRKDDKGNTRELHTEEALDVINFKASKNPKTEYVIHANDDINIVKCEYFTTNLVEIDRPMKFYTTKMDTCTVYMCLEGKFTISGGTSIVEIAKGETVLVPASMNEYELSPEGKARMMKVII